MRHHDDRRGVKTFHQNPALLIDGKIERSGYSSGIPRGQPFLSGLCQHLEYVRVINGFEQTNMSGIGTVALTVELVDLGADPSYWLAIPVRDPGLPFSMLEKWIEPGKM